MKSVEESGLSFGISRLLACAEKNELTEMTSPSNHLPLLNNVSFLQQTHSSFNQSMDIESNSNHSKSSTNGESKLSNNENTLNMMNSFVHYNNLAGIVAHTTNENFLTNGFKSPIDNPLKVSNGLNGLVSNSPSTLNVATAVTCNTTLPCIPPRRIGHPYQNRTPPKRKKPRTSFSRTQIHELERRFQRQKYLASTERANLAKDLGMSDAQVKTWYQNRRTKWRQNAEEREAERQAANRLLLSLQNQSADHSVKLGAHNDLAAAAASLVHHSANIFNSNQLASSQLTHPMSLINGHQSTPNNLLSPKIAKSNSSTSSDQTHETDLKKSANQTSQTMQRHINQLMHHQVITSNVQHSLLPSFAGNPNYNLTTTSTPSSTTSASSTTPPTQYSTSNNLVHPTSFNPSTCLATNTPNSSSVLQDFHQSSSLSAAIAALHSPGNLLNRHFSQLSNLHCLGAHYPISLAANNQSALQTNHQSLIGHLQANSQQLIDSTSATILNSSTNTVSNTTPSNLYNIDRLSQISQYAQLGFLGPVALNNLQLNASQQIENEEKSDFANEKNFSNTKISDEEACFTEDEDCIDSEENMEINVASDDEDLKLNTKKTNQIQSEGCATKRPDKRNKLIKIKRIKKLKTNDNEQNMKCDEDVNFDEDEYDCKELDENNYSKADELLRNNSKRERRKIKMKPYKLISSNSIVGSV